MQYIKNKSDTPSEVCYCCSSIPAPVAYSGLRELKAVSYGLHAPFFLKIKFLVYLPQSNCEFNNGLSFNPPLYTQPTINMIFR